MKAAKLKLIFGSWRNINQKLGEKQYECRYQFGDYCRMVFSTIVMSRSGYDGMMYVIVKYFFMRITRNTITTTVQKKKVSARRRQWLKKKCTPKFNFPLFQLFATKFLGIWYYTVMCGWVSGGWLPMTFYAASTNLIIFHLQKNRPKKQTSFQVKITSVANY